MTDPTTLPASGGRGLFSEPGEMISKPDPTKPKPGATKSKPGATKTKFDFLPQFEPFQGLSHYLPPFSIRLFGCPVDPRVQAPLPMSITLILFFVNKLAIIDFQKSGALPRSFFGAVLASPVLAQPDAGSRE
jgi:hypothetical protein